MSLQEEPFWIKICGIRDGRGVFAAQAAGATAIGFVFAPSPRQVDVATARQLASLVRSPIARVGVFLDAPGETVLTVAREVGLSHVQLHGRVLAEDIQRLRAAGLGVLQAIALRGPESLAAVEDSAADLVLLDAFVPGRAGGTGRTADWDLAAAAARRRRVILAGGLHAANVAEAVYKVRPFGVDVSSGVERRPGVKDPAKIATFVAAARHAWQTMVAREVAQHREVIRRVRGAEGAR